MRCRKKFGRGTIIKSVFDCRFISNKHTVFVKSIYIPVGSTVGKQASNQWGETHPRKLFAPPWKNVMDIV